MPGITGGLPTSAAAQQFLPCGYSAYPTHVLPFQSSWPIALTDTRVHDAQGVRMVRIGGKLFNQPVLQAEFGLLNLNAYRVTRNSAFLRRAEAQAERLVTTHTSWHGAWFEPYRFTFYLHGIRSDVLRAPWYSAMAQGESLSLFVRLYQVTHQRHWMTAAVHTFASFRVPSSSHHPWVAHVDGNHYLWLDEFAFHHANQADLTYNGHNFASYGLYDYVMQTHDANAAALLDGAWCTTAHYASTFRRPGWLSSYCLTHPSVSTARYHQVVITQFDQIYALSREPVFAAIADDYTSDYPYAHVRGTVTVAPGTVTGYRFDPAGRVTGQRTVTIGSLASARTDLRSRIKGRGIYLHLTSGTLASYWVEEDPTRAWMDQPVVARSFTPPRPTGVPTATIDRTAVIRGIAQAHLAGATPEIGAWVPMTAVRVDRAVSK